MSEDERQFRELLHDAVPAPEVVVDFDDLRRTHRRRRRTPLLIATTAAVAVAMPTTWWAASRGDAGSAPVSPPSPSASSTASPSDSGCPATEVQPEPPFDAELPVGFAYIDFVRFDGQEYVARQYADPTVTPLELWTVLGRVNCQVSLLTEDQDRKVVGPFHDLNAAYLPVGTELRAVSGYDPACRLAARVDGALRVYVAHHYVDGVGKPLDCALTPSADAPVVTRCDQLPPVPQGVETTTWSDHEHGLLEYSYGPDNTTFRISYGADPTCADRVDVSRLVGRALESADAAQQPRDVGTRPCRAVVFEGRRYALFRYPEGTGPGVGGVLGIGRVTGCPTGWSTPTVTVYSSNEQSKDEAITISDGTKVWEYTVR